MEEKTVGFDRVRIGLRMLKERFQDEPWFYDVELDQYGRYVVYSTDMTSKVTSLIHEYFGGIQVLCHYASSHTLNLNKFVHTVSLYKPQLTATTVSCTDCDVPEDFDLEELEREIKVLTDIYELHVVYNVFFEYHDKNDAVTNFSEQYPSARDKIEELYDKYGFDLLYDQLGL